jgi:phenylalanyl-tRNA synthetase alpha subunit
VNQRAIKSLLRVNETIKEDEMNEVIERDKWDSFIKDFNHRNQLRATRLQVVGGEIGAQEEEELLPLVGLSLETKGADAPRIEITLGGETAKEERHLTHTISRVRSIMTKMGVDLREEALLIEDEDGTKTILLFEALPELEPAM